MRIFIITIIFGLFFLSSCKKCMTCTIEYKSVSGNNETRELDKCARKKLVNDFESDAKSIADSLNGTVICVTD